MKKQYIIKCSDIFEREQFYNYLIKNGYKPIDNFKHQKFIDNHFPFVIEPNKTFWICESITCCAAASHAGIMITIDDYFKIIDNKTLKRKHN